MPANLKIISGGQSGVDRAALDAALKAGVGVGGWCPKGRLAEDGPLALHYPLIETRQPSFIHRTKKNVQSADATLIIHYGLLKGGTKKTLEFALELKKAHFLIDAKSTQVVEALEHLVVFLNQTKILTLNVAGPRASQWEGGYGFAFELLSNLFALLLKKKT